MPCEERNCYPGSAVPVLIFCAVTVDTTYVQLRVPMRWAEYNSGLLHEEKSYDLFPKLTKIRVRLIPGVSMG